VRAVGPVPGRLSALMWVPELAPVPVLVRVRARVASRTPAPGLIPPGLPRQLSARAVWRARAPRSVPAVSTIQPLAQEAARAPAPPLLVERASTLVRTLPLVCGSALMPASRSMQPVRTLAPPASMLTSSVVLVSGLAPLQPPASVGVAAAGSVLVLPSVPERAAQSVRAAVPSLPAREQARAPAARSAAPAPVGADARRSPLKRPAQRFGKTQARHAIRLEPEMSRRCALRSIRLESHSTPSRRSR
jgi:hypothetical protein